MKKIMRGVCLMGVLALLATSCDKNKETATLKTFNEQFEVVDFDGEKIYLDQSDNKLYFEAEDLLTLFRVDEDGMTYADYTPAETQVDQTTWTPVDEALAEGGDLYAFCPGGSDYVAVDPETQNDNRVTFRLPVVQNYRESTCPVEGFFMAAKLEEGQESFFFRNICGLLRLRLYSAKGRTVTSIVVKDKDKNLSGDVSMKIDKVNPTTLTSLFKNYNENDEAYMQTLSEYIAESGYYVTNAGDQITLDCGNGVQIGTTSKTATDFYICLRPLALRKGCEITINYDGGSYTINSSKNNIISPNVIRRMNPVNIN